MFDDLDQSLQFSALFSYLSIESGESGDLLESLAVKLETALPQCVVIKREGGLFSRKKTVNEIIVDLDDATYKIARTHRGTHIASIMKKVRGIVLKTNETPVAQWIESLVQELCRMAEKSAETRDALEKMVRG